MGKKIPRIANFLSNYGVGWLKIAGGSARKIRLIYSLKLSSSARRQATEWRSPRASRAGTAAAHFSMAKGHRVRNTQPEGGLIGLGKSPFSVMRLRRTRGSGTG